MEGHRGDAPYFSLFSSLYESSVLASDVMKSSVITIFHLLLFILIHLLGTGDLSSNWQNSLLDLSHKSVS